VLNVLRFLGAMQMHGMGGSIVVPNVNPVFRDVTKSEAENEDLRNRLEQQKLQKGIDASLTGGDQAIGEERMQKDMTAEDIDNIRVEYEEKYGKATYVFDWSRVLTMGISGALVGGIICLLYFQKNEYQQYFQYAMVGIFSGGFMGIVIMTCLQGAMMYRAEARDPFQMAMNQRKETMRRMEQEAMERHDEFVYYDSFKEHSRAFTLCCCPSYGKITSRRIIYSQPNPMDIACLPTWLTGWWCKRAETMDYRLIDDVSVEQSCSDFFSGAGTIIVHIKGSHDTSIITEERERLVRALQTRDLIQLKQAERISSRLEDQSGLYEELADVQRAIADLEAEDRKTAEAEGRPFRPVHVLDIANEMDVNTAQQIRIISVTNPFSVMDDLSYRISTSGGVTSSLGAPAASRNTGRNNTVRPYDSAVVSNV